MGTDQRGSLASGARSSVRLTLLGGFRVEADGVSHELSPASQRLVALVALRGPIGRSEAASTLWSSTTDRRTDGTLRTALWRLRARCDRLLFQDGERLALQHEVCVDVTRLIASAAAVTDVPKGESPPADDQEVLVRSAPLLPGWYEDWALLEREGLDLVRVRALEVLASRLLAADRPAEALEASLEAVRVEPLRESAHRAVLAAHLAEGNVVEARRHLAMAARLLKDEFGAAPTAGILPDGWPG